MFKTFFYLFAKKEFTLIYYEILKVIIPSFFIVGQQIVTY